MPYGFPGLKIQGIWSHILDDTKKKQTRYIFVYILEPVINIGYFWISNNETNKQVEFSRL